LSGKLASHGAAGCGLRKNVCKQKTKNDEGHVHLPQRPKTKQLSYLLVAASLFGFLAFWFLFSTQMALFLTQF
jgi:hypothetical protein